MNLSAHGTASPDPSKALLLVKKRHTQLITCHASAWRVNQCRLAVYVPPPGTMAPNRSSLPCVRLADLTSLPGASLCRPP